MDVLFEEIRHAGSWYGNVSDYFTVRRKASFICLAERWVNRVGSQVATFDVFGFRRAGSAFVPGPSCLSSLSGFVFLSVRAGVPWFELDPLDGMELSGVCSFGPTHRIVL